MRYICHIYYIYIYLLGGLYLDKRENHLFIKKYILSINHIADAVPGLGL